MLRELRVALSLLLLLSLLTGVAYPVLVTGIAQVVFPFEANGSLLGPVQAPVGSALLGQAFGDAGHFWSRPSATAPQPYNGLASGGANLGPTNPALLEAVHSRVNALRASDPGNPLPVPLDLVTTSASGLDPHISPAAATWQVQRVARARHLQPSAVQALVQELVEPRTFGLFGEARVNVLQLNLALERRFPAKS